MQKILKKILWFLLTLLIAAILFCLLIFLFTRNKNKSDSHINIYTVSEGTIEDTIEVYGNAELKKEQSVTFELPGTVENIYVNEWDLVRKGQILASLDTENLDNDIRQAELSLENAQINYQDLKNWWTDTQILQAENTLEQSRSALKLAEQQLDELEDNSSIDTVWNNNETILKSTVLSIKDYINQSEKAITSLDKIFGVSSKYANENDVYEEYLSKKKTSYKSQTNRNISKAYDLLDDLKDEYDDLDRNVSLNDKSEILRALRIANNLFETLYDASESAYNALENSEVNEILTSTMIWNFESIVSNTNTLARSSQSAILNSNNNINNLSSSNSNDLAIQAKENEIENLKNSIRLQEQSLQDIKKWWTDSQKNIAANTVEQWEITVNKAKKWLESYQITAPFDWVIRKIDFEIWDKIYSTNPKFIYIENPDLIEISVQLDQIDIVKVSEWMPAEVEFDAYPGEIFYGTISDIDTKANITAWVVSYTVKIHIEKWDYMILWWMTANVKIIIDRQENVLQVPSTYIQTIWEKNYVVNGSGDLVEIEIWISNDSMIEIVSGLNNWDQIIKEVSKTATNGLGEDLMEMHNEYNQ